MLITITSTTSALFSTIQSFPQIPASRIPSSTKRLHCRTINAFRNPIQFFMIGHAMKSKSSGDAFVPHEVEILSMGTPDFLGSKEDQLIMIIVNLREVISFRYFQLKSWRHKAHIHQLRTRYSTMPRFLVTYDAEDKLHARINFLQ